MINKELLEILRCPEAKTPLVLENDSLVSLDKNTRRSYPIKDEVPIMLLDQSTQLSLEEWTSIMKKHGKSVN